jgi:hypothetical protein
MSGLGISYLPPTETLPIFDSSVFPLLEDTTTSDANKLDYPTAQGAESFPQGLSSQQIIPLNTNPFYTNSNAIGYTFSVSPAPPQYTLNTTTQVGGYYYTQWGGFNIPTGLWLVNGYVYFSGTTGYVDYANNYLRFSFVSVDDTSNFIEVASQNAINVSTNNGINTQLGCPTFSAVIASPIFGGGGYTPHTLQYQTLFIVPPVGGGVWKCSEGFFTFTRIA